MYDSNRRLRREEKFLLPTAEAAYLAGRLTALMKPDPHSAHGLYTVDSLYFDTPNADSLQDKQAGTNNRERFRLRYYNGDLSYVCLESKANRGTVRAKASQQVDADLFFALALGKSNAIEPEAPGLLGRFRMHALCKPLLPTVMVRYERAAFQYADCRITFDFDLRGGAPPRQIRTPPTPGQGEVPAKWFGFGGIPVLSPDVCILEVKYTDVLPAAVRHLLSPARLQASAVSKFELCMPARLL
ncbi:MAG: polyphosphate polymerase domain-containing protein [Oscillospiraceae bacterium]|jgi:hypothetical protein|nr:polyphosphate polymerase domain-containing protein [Oscillospiraceae bacterium]